MRISLVYNGVKKEDVKKVKRMLYEMVNGFVDGGGDCKVVDDDGDCGWIDVLDNKVLVEEEGSELELIREELRVIKKMLEGMLRSGSQVGYNM